MLLFHDNRDNKFKRKEKKVTYYQIYKSPRQLPIQGNLLPNLQNYLHIHPNNYITKIIPGILINAID